MKEEEVLEARVVGEEEGKAEAIPWSQWQQEVLADKKELDAKIEKLERFMAEKYEDTHRYERNRLDRQLDAMKEYSDALRDRIKHFNQSRPS